MIDRYWITLQNQYEHFKLQKDLIDMKILWVRYALHENLVFLTPFAYETIFVTATYKQQGNFFFNLGPFYAHAARNDRFPFIKHSQHDFACEKAIDTYDKNEFFSEVKRLNLLLVESWGHVFQVITNLAGKKKSCWADVEFSPK